jgi:hypothetical protein
MIALQRKKAAGISRPGLTVMPGIGLEKSLNSEAKK